MVYKLTWQPHDFYLKHMYRSTSKHTVGYCDVLVRVYCVNALSVRNGVGYSININ